MQRKALVVDDEADLRRILLCVLAPVCEVLEASNGPEALRLLRNERPRLMLLDISMPEMGGIAILEAALVSDPSLIIVMLTGEQDLAVAKRALEAGARAYITKPFDSQFLRVEVQRLLEIVDAVPYRPWRVLS